MTRILRPSRFPILFLFAAGLLPAQIQNHGATKPPAEAPIQVGARPGAALAAAMPGDVSLVPGLFRDRRELTKSYLLRLQTEKILQNYFLEAGVRIDLPYDQFYQGWEAPSSQLRGHFARHWLSAVAHMAAVDHDPLLAERAGELVRGLQRCQELNGGEWVGSIPEKYFRILAEGKEWVWSPQYTLHKTMMGLFDDYRYLHDREALAVLEHSADWFCDWTEKMIREGRGEVIYNGECAGMLELWSDLYGATGNPKYLRLAARYALPDMFTALLAGGDPLTNDHANASIPWVQGAARLYEVTGDARYRRIVEAFWKTAVENRGMFATTGANAGEFWIPPHEFGRFLGNRTQEHCTVYNMIRVAQYLFLWTGEARYADYIERALYNGTLAQQNPQTGLVCYFLPLAPGAQKTWGTETRDFWCCQGTLVQADAMFEDLIYYQAPDGVTVGQFIPSQAVLGRPGKQARITLHTDPSGGRNNFIQPGDVTAFALDLDVVSDDPDPWTLRIRQPAWAIGPGSVTVNGTPVAAPVSPSGFLELRRNWTDANVRVCFAKRVTMEPLPGDGRRVALLDGPVVLAALTSAEPELASRPDFTPQYEHQYVEGQDWQSSHFLTRTRQGTVALKPIFEVVDEPYSVYFAVAR